MTHIKTNENPGQVAIVQFGEGNFLRAFVDWMLQKLKDKGHFTGEVHVLQPIAEGRCAALSKSNAGYHAVLQGVLDGHEVCETTTIDVVNSWTNPYEVPGILEKLAHLAVSMVVISNTTEAGIIFDPACKLTDEPPVSFPAKLTKFLYARFDYQADQDVYILPCELIDQNGDALHKAVTQYSKSWLLGNEFDQWLESKVIFYNTLVDRIVSGYPRYNKHPKIEKLAAIDENLVVAEPYHLWVLEGPEKLEELLPFGKAGLNVIYTNRLKAYRELKVRILNGLHTAMVPLGIASGLKYVGECFEEPSLQKFLEDMLNHEIIPCLTSHFSAEYLQSYSQRILDRFRNPYLKHKLADISLNSLSKIQARLFPTIEDYLEVEGVVPTLTTCAVASLLFNYATQPENFTINEADPQVNSALQKAQEVYRNTSSWPYFLESLYDNQLILPAFTDVFRIMMPSLSIHLQLIEAHGIKRFAERLNTKTVFN